MPRTKIIAECATNHEGSLDRAKEMICAAAEAGADIVKFQSWQAKTLVNQQDSGMERYRRSELSDDAHRELMEECRLRGVQFLTTCFDIGRVEFLGSLGLPVIKVASLDVGSVRMLEALKQHFDELIVSTGMTNVAEIRRCVEALADRNLTLLHCVTLYPTPAANANMARMDWLRKFTPQVGYSDHTLGTDAAKLAIARGAVYVEKHFTLDRSLGPSHAFCATPEEIRDMAQWARTVEELNGQPDPALSETEVQNRKFFIGRWGDNR